MKKSSLPENSEVLEIKKGDLIVCKVAPPIAAEAVIALEQAIKEKLPASIRDDVGVIVVDHTTEISVKKAENDETE